MEVRELLSSYDYDGDDAPFVMGSALAAVEGTDEELGKNAIEKLVNAMDEFIPVPERDVDKDFSMDIESSFAIPGRGTVATGTITQGKVKVNEEVDLIGLKRKPTRTTVIGVETFKKTLDHGEAGDNVGLLLRGLNRDDIARGMALVKPGSIGVNRTFEGEVYVLKEEEGGRHKPFSTGYRPQCFMRTADSSCSVTLPESTSMALPGDNLKMQIKLSYPLPIEKGLRFAMREGGRTVAAGVISDIIPDTAEDLKEEEERLAKTKK